MLDINVIDPLKLLILKLESQFKEFDNRIWAVADWSNQASSRPLYPFPIRWNLMTKEVLRELGVVKERITDLNMLKSVVDGKKS